jgi:hypothetical protein
MEGLRYPPDRACNLLHQAIRAGELTPRNGGLCAPAEGPKLGKWDRDHLDFDFSRYQNDVRSGRPVGSLLIGRQCLHPHEITIPVEEVEHWLEPLVSTLGAKRTLAGGASTVRVPANSEITSTSDADEVASDRTGTQGRPTSRHLVTAEFARRAANNEPLDKLNAESAILSDWLQQRHPNLAPMTPKTVENCIRIAYRLWKAPK